MVVGRVLLWGMRLDWWVLRRIRAEVPTMLVALMMKVDLEQYFHRFLVDSAAAAASDPSHRLSVLLLLRIAPSLTLLVAAR